MRRRRTLRPEEEALWAEVARSAAPLHAPFRVKSPEQPKTLQPEPPSGLILKPFSLGDTAAPRPQSEPKPTALRMDAKAFTKLTRGKLAPEARIDLHGMTLSEAHPELIRFILNAQSNGLRLVLVITGKGRAGDSLAPDRRGILRQQVPHWLRLPPLGPAILQVTESHLRHGGGGALYVYLRRSR